MTIRRTGRSLPLCAVRKEERCLNPLGHRRAVTSEHWYRGRGSNSTAPLCRRGALNQKATPAFWLWGQDSNLRISWLTASCLTAWLPHKNWSGTSDLNRDSLGPRLLGAVPSGSIRFPGPRCQRSGVSGWNRTSGLGLRKPALSSN